MTSSTWRGGRVKKKMVKIRTEVNGCVCVWGGGGGREGDP